MNWNELQERAEFIGPFDREIGGYPVRDADHFPLGIADDMPNNDEEFEALVASAEILRDYA